MFLVCGFINYQELKHLGVRNSKAKIKYTGFYKTKVAFCLILVLINCWDFVGRAFPDNKTTWLNKCSNEANALVMISDFMQAVAWVCSIILYVYEYNRGMSETWYSH